MNKKGVDLNLVILKCLAALKHTKNKLQHTVDRDIILIGTKNGKHLTLADIDLRLKALEYLAQTISLLENGE